MRWLVALAVLAGCASRCKEVADARRALAAHAAVAGPHAQIRIPFARANALVAELLRDEPLSVPIELPGLARLALPSHQLTAIAREVRLERGAPDRVRFAVRLDLVDGDQPVTTLALEIEVRPVVTPTALVVGFGPDNLVALHPVLDPDARRTLAAALARWLPDSVRTRVPQVLLEGAVGELGEQVTGAAYELLQKNLLYRLGELTRVRVALPDLPIERVATASTDDALAIDLELALPVRAGVAASAPTDDDIAVRISGSAVAEVANWAIANGHLPPWYTRDLEPKPEGEYRPYFDYRADDRVRPLKVHVVQERGGCSYFRVGLRPELAVVDDKLEIGMRDRYVERAVAGTLLELGLWFKQLVEGSIDSTKRAVARIELSVGHRQFATRVVRAAIVADELRLVLAVTAKD